MTDILERRLSMAQKRRWNVWALERLAGEVAGENAARDEEWKFLLHYLREYADAEGLLPLDFDEVVRESFGDFLPAPVAPPPVPEPEPIAEIEPVPVPEPVAEIEPVPAPEPEPVAEIESEPVAEIEPEPEPVAEVVPEPEPEPVAEVVPEPEPEPVAEIAPEPEPEPTPALAVAAVAEPKKSRRDRAKKYLVLLVLLGLITYVIGGSTFATFSAETGNLGNGISSGTLTLTDKVNTLNACTSYGATSKDNYNAGCNAALTLTNLAPGVVGGQSKLTIANNGSIDASRFSLYAPYVNATLSQPVSSGATVGTGQTVTSFTVTPLEGPVSSGDTIVLNYGTVTQQFCAGAAALAGATSITISGGYTAGTTGSCSGTPPTTTAGTTFATGTRLNDTSSDTTASTADCWDAQTTTPGVANATKGTDLNFNLPAGNLCSTALLYVQEQTNGNNYCWFGRGSPYGDQGGFTEDSNGQCRTPTTMTLGTNVNSATGTTTTVTGGIAVAAGSFTVASNAGFPTAGLPGTPFTIVVDQEEMTVTSASGTTWTVTRGANNTTAAAHSVGGTATVTLMATTASLQTTAVLSGNIRANDSITFAENGVTMTCTAGSTYYINYDATVATGTPIPLTGCSTTGGTTTFDSSAVVRDLSAFTALNGGNGNSTISSFDTSHHLSGPIFMPPLTGNGANNAGAAVQLAKSGGTGGVPDTRVFYVGVYFPAPGGGNQNYLQGLISTFGLTWHIDQ